MSEEEISVRASVLLKELRFLWETRREKVESAWNRTLPFADYIVDRWKRAEALGFGAGTSIYDSSLVFGDVTVGENTWIGPSTVLDGTGQLTIGDTCSISAGVQIYTHDTVRWALSGGIKDAEYASVTIEDRCYIGPNVIISKGVVIGEGCVIGANSFVNKSIPSGSKAYGTPCRVIGKVEL